MDTNERPTDPTTPSSPALSRRGFLSGAALAGAGLAAAPLAWAASPNRPNSTVDRIIAVEKVLVINAHQRYPGISEGRLNATFAALIKEEMEQKGREVRETRIEAGYDSDEEMQKHLWADLIVTQSPVFWFGSPWIHKKYVDDVFTAGMLQSTFLAGDGRSAEDPSRQYGTGGLLQGKRYLLSLTMNTPREAFDDPAQRLHAGRSLDDLFAAHMAAYRFCGVAALPVFGSFNVVRAADVAGDSERLRQHLATHVG